MQRSKNEELLESFFNYCIKHPEQRFWQALRNWAGLKFIVSAEELDVVNDGLFHKCRDTFNWVGKSG